MSNDLPPSLVPFLPSQNKTVAVKMCPGSHKVATRDLELEDALATAPLPPSWEIEPMRQLADTTIEAQSNLSFDGVHIGQVHIPVKGGEILAHTYWPSSAGEGDTYPLLLNFHGGGYVLGKAALDHPLCHKLSLAHNISILNVEYRLAPEHPFPTLPDDCYAALKWATKNSAQLKADLNKGLLVCGTSAGGNLAASLALQARDEPSLQVKLTGQILIIPELYSKTLHPFDQYKEELQSFDSVSDPALPKEAILLWTNAYEAGASKEELMSSKRSPLLALSLSNLPPAALLVAGADSLRDEAILYAKLLAQANGENSVKLHVYPSGFHGFHLTLPHLAASKKFYQDLDDELRWLLKGSS